MTKLVVGSATDVGLVRSNNQDQYLVAPGLYAVADGMGGHAAGEVASETAIEALRDAFEHTVHTAESLVSAAKTANRAVWDQARANRGMLGMGTTLIALAVVEDRGTATGMAIAHIGDSRAYLYRRGSLRQLTTDHSLVQELIDDGQITPEQAAVHPQRHVLTRALGVEPTVEVDLLRLAPQHGDRYLLCSDGLPREASDEQIAAVLSRFADPAEAAKELVALANSKGGSDNVTVVVVDVMANDPTGERLVVVPGPASSAAPGAAAPGDGASLDLGVEDMAFRAGPDPAEGAGAERAGPGHKAVPTAEQQPGDGSLTSAVPVVAQAPGTKAHRWPIRPRARGGHSNASPRWVTWRVVGFLAALCLVVGGAIAGLAWYARSTYYVTITKGHLAIYQGRPGGVLWFDPTLAQLTSYTPRSVLSYQVQTLRTGQLEPTLKDARSYISNLVAAKKAAQGAGVPPVPTSTTTSRPTTSSTPTTSRVLKTSSVPYPTSAPGAKPSPSKSPSTGSSGKTVGTSK